MGNSDRGERNILALIIFEHYSSALILISLPLMEIVPMDITLTVTVNQFQLLLLYFLQYPSAVYDMFKVITECVEIILVYISKGIPISQVQRRCYVNIYVILRFQTLCSSVVIVFNSEFLAKSLGSTLVFISFVDFFFNYQQLFLYFPPLFLAG